MLHRLLCLAGAGIFATTPSFAQHSSIENGLPCVQELCVDDDLSSLLHLPWLDVNPPASPASPAAIEELLRADEDVLRTVGMYWPGHVFNAQGLAALSQVKAVCREIGVHDRPRAEFLSADGRRTWVTFEPEPSVNGRGVVFRVAEIERRAPPDASGDQISAWGRAVDQNYAGLSDYASTTGAGVQWRASGPQGPVLLLVAAVGNPQQRAADLSRHPMCQAD
jgi:hypothetical protein